MLVDGTVALIGALVGWAEVLTSAALGFQGSFGPSLDQMDR
jgi:hypothetical protein